jgi:Fe2+ transport system protein FeoA
LEDQLKAVVVWLILNGKVEEALEVLAEKYSVKVPAIRVGLPKKHRLKAMGCYEGKKKMILVLDSHVMKDPFVILHEFYHHMRTNREAEHKGTEKYADAFAKDFILAFKSAVKNGK